MYDECSRIIWNQIPLTLLLSFFIFNTSRSKSLSLLSPPLEVFFPMADSESTKGSDGCREHKSSRPFGAVFLHLAKEEASWREKIC